ncbi:MAG: hypothetical protein AB7R77_26315 [Ilumatobacteraceae bacterium]
MSDIAASIAEIRDNPLVYVYGADESFTRVLDFADDCDRMLSSLAVVSFPFTHAVQISVTDPDAELYITEGTARLLHAALGRALGMPAPTGMRAD